MKRIQVLVAGAIASLLVQVALPSFLSPPKVVAALPVECAAPPLTATNPTPTTSSTNWPLAAPTRMGLPAPGQGINIDVRKSLNNVVEYNAVTWFQTCYGGQTGPINPNGVSEVAVRSPAMAAYSMAVALKTGGYDATATGLPAATALARTRQLAVGLAMNHRVNKTGGWGHNWQSSYWAFFAGSAGWMLFNDMTHPERQAIARMVADEADYQISKPAATQVPYYANRSGVVQYPGDTKAEENAWNSTILGLARTMLPQDSRMAGWRRLEANFQISAFSRPADLTSQTMINGKTVSAWLGGSNIFNDGTLVNHNRINPEYMTTVSMNLNGMLTAGIDGKPGLRTATTGSAVVYHALPTKNFTSPPYAAPGGTMYVQNAYNIYYPQGNDWGTVRISPYLAFDSLGGTIGFGTAVNARTWMGRHMVRQLALQARFADGRTFAGKSTDANSEYKYIGREQVTAGDLAQTWLNQYLSHNALLATTNDPV